MLKYVLKEIVYSHTGDNKNQNDDCITITKMTEPQRVGAKSTFDDN